MGFNPKITPQFKTECVEYALNNSDRPLKELAEKLGIGKSTLSKWVKQHQSKNGATGKRVLTEEQKQIAQLKKEVAHLQEVNEILKKATTYFAAQSDRRGMSL